MFLFLKLGRPVSPALSCSQVITGLPGSAWHTNRPPEMWVAWEVSYTAGTSQGGLSPGALCPSACPTSPLGSPLLPPPAPAQGLWCQGAPLSTPSVHLPPLAHSKSALGAKALPSHPGQAGSEVRKGGGSHTRRSQVSSDSVPSPRPGFLAWSVGAQFLPVPTSQCEESVKMKWHVIKYAAEHTGRS